MGYIRVTYIYTGMLEKNMETTVLASGASWNAGFFFAALCCGSYCFGASKGGMKVGGLTDP